MDKKISKYYAQNFCQDIFDLPNAGTCCRNPPPVSIRPEGRQLKAMPDRAKAILKNWFLRHQADPYPSKLKKQKLAEETGLTLTQVGIIWFKFSLKILKYADNSET